MTNRIPVGVFFALFTVSGFAGLIYQSIWSHYLKLFLGHAAYAQTLVLAIFMGGMALGSWLVSRYTHRIRDLLLGYAIAEFGIGILAVVFHRVFLGATAWAFDSVMPALGGTGVDLFKWTLASALILPASVLLGTTFPLMSAGLIRVYPDASGKALSMLYFTNSFGAAVGVLASGFYLIAKLGLPGTILTAGLMNVALAFAVWMLTKRLPHVTPPAAPQASDTAGQVSSLQAAILTLACLTGAASFIYEVTWIRMLTLGLGASTHSFEVMLAAFILGMSWGAYLLRNRIGKLRNDLGWLSGLLFLKAFFAVYAVWIYSDVLDFIGWMMQAVARSDGGYVLVTLAGLAASMIVMLPTAICAGMTLPLATHALTSRGFGEASIGKVYGANTAGCILGAGFATHIGIEALGVKGLTGVGAILDVGVAVLVVALSVEAVRRGRAFAAMAIVCVAGAIGFASIDMDLVRMSSGVFRYGTFADPKANTVKFYRDGKTATISVMETTSGQRSIRTNGKPDAAITYDPKRRAAQDESTMVLAAAIPLALKPQATDVANIGFGSGLTTHALLGSPNIKVLDSIEIERAMIEGAKFFSPRNDRAYQDPRSKIHIEDAKTFFATHGKRYDYIVSEPSNPWVSGVSTLFSEEFYGQVKRYLKDDGVLIQWVQVYEINVQLLSTIFTALGKHFPDYTVYSPTIGDLIIVATPGKALPPLSPELFSMPLVKADLEYLGVKTVGDIAAMRVGSRATLEPLFAQGGGVVNSDFFPVVDQYAPRSRFKRENADDLRRARNTLVPVLAMLEGEYRTPLARIAEVGLNRPARINSAVEAAEAVGIFVTGSAESARALSPAERTQAAVGHALLGDCSKARDTWLDSVDFVARLSMPFLDGPAVGEFLQKATSSACFKSLDEFSRRQVTFLEALNARDPRRIRDDAEWLLERLTPAQEPRRATYVVAAMSGNLALKEADKARAVWDRNVAKLSEEATRELVTRTLLGHLRISAAVPAEPPAPAPVPGLAPSPAK